MYESNDSGGNQIYVRPFPAVDTGRWQVSTSGGTRPVWARSGRELFYVAGAENDTVRMMAVPVQVGARFSADNPRTLFEGRYFVNSANQFRPYDVSADGKSRRSDRMCLISFLSASGVVSVSATPPAAGTRNSDHEPPTACMNTMVPFASHAPVGTLVSANVSGGPLLTEIFLSLPAGVPPPVKKPIHSPSGEKNGLYASSVPRTG